MDTNTPKKRGPKPQIDGEIMKRQIVTIDSMTRRKLMVLGTDEAGKSVLSRGVRRAAEIAYEKYQNTKD
jgi:hypothetical protein